MLTIRAMSDGAGYSERHLQYSDYLDEENKVQGQWRGKGAERLGLTGEVTAESFERLREAEHPLTGKFLRQRRSADRIAADGTKQSNAVNFFDLTFSAPKSISIQGIVGNDPRLLEAHNKAVEAALREVESCASVEDQRNKQKQVRQSGNLVMATYSHLCSRQLDAQAHVHTVVFNLSYDQTSGKWKALDSRQIYQRRKYLSEVFRNVLASEVMKLGYEIENRWNERGTDQSFEIKQISPDLCRKFSKRSAEKETAIGQFVAERGRMPSDNEISVLVRNTREDKLKQISATEVRHYQQSQLTAEEAGLLRQLRLQAEQNRFVPEHGSALDSLEYAKEHLFERVSVTTDHQLLSEALQHGRGRIDLAELKRQLEIQKISGALIHHQGQVATRESLEREKYMIGVINRGNGCCSVLGREEGKFIPNESLSSEQRHAVEFILRSQDFAVCLQGAAGTGKTDTLKEIERGLREAGRGVAAVAPTQTAVRELKERGFDLAMTIDRLLVDSTAQDNLLGKVLVVDEAGMVSGEKMSRLLQLVEKNHGRLIFVGDTRQIKSVEASDALRILQKESKLKTTKLREVRRQIDPKYRAAAKMLWKDRARGFRKLEKMGAVKEVPFLDRPQATVEAFLDAKKQPNVKGDERTVIVVSATHADVDRYTEAIRSHLKSAGKLVNGQTLECFEPLHWTTAQRKDFQRYQAGHVLIFHKAVMNAGKNEAFTVVRTEGSKIICANRNGKETSFTGKQAGAFNVFSRQSVEIAPGDQILLLANSKQRGCKLTNGDVAVVKEIDDKGRVHLVDGRVLPASYRQFKHGYAMTAHRSQARTADAVIVSADRMNGDLFYVAASRGREMVCILTSDLTQLRESVSCDGDRLSAIELMQASERKRKKQRDQSRKVANDYQQKLLTRRKRERDNARVPSLALQSHFVPMVQR